MNNLSHSIFVHELDPGIKVQSLQDVKLEVIDSEPLHLYFTNGIARAKLENGEIHLTLDQLNGADTKYKRIFVTSEPQPHLSSALSQPQPQLLSSDKQEKILVGRY